MQEKFGCPWWVPYIFDNPFRRWIHPPEKVMAPYVGQGQTAVDIGCGHGHFTLGMARLVGPTGKVVAADIHPAMLKITMRRAAKAGLADCVQDHLCPSDHLGLDLKADFITAFWVVHAVPDKERFFLEVAGLLAPQGRFLIAEPNIHVKREKFEDELALAVKAGLQVEESPRLWGSRTALMTALPDAA
jgi:ubiquinone/menaquinone biosynthesis C-methylase UbiE